MSRWKLVLVVIIGILAIIVVVQNTQTVDTKLLFVTVTMPRAVLLFITLVIGFVIGVLSAEKITRKRAVTAAGG